MNKQNLIEKYEGISNFTELVRVEHVIKNLRQLDEPQPIKLKDIISRMDGLSEHTRSEWLNDILYKIGSDYGALKYKARYEQRRLEGTLEREKVVVPQFVADWYEEKKNNLDYNIWNYVYEWENQEEDEFRNWFNHSNKAFQTLVNMHQFGYEVKKERWYEVKLKNTDDYLVKTNNDDYRFYNNIYTNRRKHTYKELEGAGFGWVFDCPGVEIEEVE